MEHWPKEIRLKAMSKNKVSFVMSRGSSWNKDHQVLSLLSLIYQVLSNMKHEELGYSPTFYIILSLFSRALQEEKCYLPTLSEYNSC